MVDGCICAVAFFLSVFMWQISGGELSSFMDSQFWPSLLYVVAAHLLLFILGGMYIVLWRFADVSETLRLIMLGICACALTLVVKLGFGLEVPAVVLVMTSAITIVTVVASRAFWRLLRGGRLRLRDERRTRTVMVVGAGEAGAYVITRCLSGVEHKAKTIVLVDDDPNKQKLRVHNVPVRGTSADIPELIKTFNVQEIIIAIPSLRGEKFTNLVSLCSSTKCRVRVLGTPSQEEFEEKGQGAASLKLREVDATDFLSRPEVRLDVDKISSYITGKSILVTGGGGSIGSELCRSVMKFSPASLTIFDFYENNAYELLTELRRIYGRSCQIKVLIGSIREPKRLDAVFAECRPDVVFHAAAHKHVSLMENSPGEAIKNNVIGTRNVLEAAAKSGVERFVLLSTDKAVNPTNIMGATKRVCEMLVQSYAKSTQMKCMAVRFGNVLGSHGSVIPLFEAQIRAGGPVTVTDPSITRYFMTIPEAAQLVLQAGGLADSGAIYVLDMGEPVRIMDLAEKMIRFFGYIPNEDIHILFTGLRKGEKLYEELLTEAEKAQIGHTTHEKIFVAPPIGVDEETLMWQLGRLVDAAENHPERLHELMEEIVVTYRRQEEYSSVAV